MYRYDQEQAQALYDRIQREYACEHPRRALAVKVCSNGSRSFRRQCLRCGAIVETVSARALSPRAQAQAIPFDEDLARRWNDAKWGRHKELTDEAMAKEQAEWGRWYAAYLLTPEWRKKRSLVLARAGGVCEGCRSRPATQVHHLTYKRAGREMLFDLVAICDECHEAVHEGSQKE